MSANPANPEEGIAPADGPVSGAPEHMLQLRIVPVGPLGVKEELDESRRLVVKYDPYMQVVNGMLGSSAGNMHRLGELLRDAVDGSAQGQFAEAISAAAEDGERRGRNDVLSASSEQIAELQADFASKAAVLGERIEFLEKELADAKKPAAQRATHATKKDEGSK